MSTVNFKILQDGFAFKKDNDPTQRYINCSLKWVDDPVTGNIDFLPVKSESFSFNTSDIISIDSVLIVGTHAQKVIIFESTRFNGKPPVTNLVAATYAAMLLLATGDQFKRIKVLNDEHQGLTNTTYEYWPGLALDWVAVTNQF